VNGIIRFGIAVAIAALSVVSWVVVACLVMLVVLYVVRLIPMTGRTSTPRDYS